MTSTRSANSLGQLWLPRLFEGGFAIRRDSCAPPYPVSHGCVRVSNEAIDWIWAQNLAPIGTEVWVDRSALEEGTTPRSRPTSRPTVEYPESLVTGRTQPGLWPCRWVGCGVGRPGVPRRTRYRRA